MVWGLINASPRPNFQIAETMAGRRDNSSRFERKGMPGSIHFGMPYFAPNRLIN